MKSLLSVLVFSVMFPIMAFAGTVKIAELNWQSGSMLANIDAYIIENAIKVAVNNALEKAKDTSAKRLKSVTGGLMDNIPGF